MSKGIWAAVSAALTAGLLPVFTKVMMNHGVTDVEVMVVRYLGVFLFAGIGLMLRGQGLRITGRQFVTLVLLTVFGYAGACYLLAAALNFLPVGMATMLYFTYPLFTMLIMTLVFREKPTGRKLVALALAILGIAALMGFDFSVFNIGSLLALGAGLTYGIYLVGIQKSCVCQLDNMVITFYLAGISWPLFLIQGWGMGVEHFMALTPTAWGVGMVMGLITVFVLVVVAYATKSIGSTRTSLIIAFEAVVSLVLGILIFGEAWTGFTVVGSVLMLGAVILVTREKA
ncbi:MAG: DMT family transporter [Eubacterium aggregans]|uniref:DMT family transporter n=1 Tax=Eubacterium aggregans TaxID=81409 RepID=UPI002B1FB886|nr:DMT family transporter [Eubacterium aggregans]MEA5072934.1 DMT family transporter [Eubacterium aggregans]